jgi:hypothetical protein
LWSQRRGWPGGHEVDAHLLFRTFVSVEDAVSLIVEVAVGEQFVAGMNDLIDVVGELIVEVEPDIDQRLTGSIRATFEIFDLIGQQPVMDCWALARTDREPLGACSPRDVEDEAGVAFAGRHVVRSRVARLGRPMRAAVCGWLRRIAQPAVKSATGNTNVTRIESTSRSPGTRAMLEFTRCLRPLGRFASIGTREWTESSRARELGTA